jgi:hypothetical protein
MTPHCSACPEPPDLPCCGHLCELAGTAPHWDAHILARNALPCPGAEPAPAPPPLEPATALRDRRLALAMAELCPYREPLSSTGCGCTARCWANRGYRGGPIVNADECIACQTHPFPT